MESPFSLSLIEAKVRDVKEEIFSSPDLYSFVSPSAYDTAWLAMIPDTQKPDSPMFEGCLKWILQNQNKDGFWGSVPESNTNRIPAIDALPATLACLVALQKWNVGHQNIKQGLEFIHSSITDMLLTTTSSSSSSSNHLPRWFTVVFPAMVELAEATGLELYFPESAELIISNIFIRRQQILEREELVDEYLYPPLLSYLETLTWPYQVDQGVITKHLNSNNGSLFQSPSATAAAFMSTGNRKCLNYLESLAERFPDNGVPSIYPMDEELIRLCMVDQIQRLGLADYFNQEIDDILAQVYRAYKIQESKSEKIEQVPLKMYKDSLAFRLLRLHGYCISPWNFSWFLSDEKLLDHIENNYECFTSTMYNVYRATDFMFSGEYELEQARSFSRKILEKQQTKKMTMTMLRNNNRDDNVLTFSNIDKMIEHELSLPWLARLEHLDHRMWIEENKVGPLWIGKASFYRLSCIHNEKLMRLATENYGFRQSIYRDELEELKRWSKKWGLSNIGFGREKTTYLYFAVAASTSLPADSLIRLLVAKSAIIITIADDFFDMEGSLSQLQDLTCAVQKWDGKDLNGHGKIIFDALDNLVSGIVAEYFHQNKTDITKSFRDIWKETFESWLVEATWSKSGYIPSMEEYMEFGMKSIAIHALVLPASCFLSPCIPRHKLQLGQYDAITLLLMITARILNDIQSYQKEEKDGKKNLVMLHMKQNPAEADVRESITRINEVLEEKKREFLKHALIDDDEGMNGLTSSGLPKPSKRIHLSCLKVFQMFFNSSNMFDSNTAMIQDIKKAIYIPVEYQKSEPMLPLPLLNNNNNNPRQPAASEKSTINLQLHQGHLKKSFWKSRNFTVQCFSINVQGMGRDKLFVPPKPSSNLCFV